MKLIIEKGQDNPILRKKSTPVKTSELHLYRVLTETMLAYIKNPKHGGIGLAAPQVGINKRIIVVGLQNKRDDDTYSIVVMINPEIKQKSPQTDIDEEGCLSLPGLL